MELTNEDIAELEAGIRNVFLEESVTVSFPKTNDIGTFSKTYNLGISIDVPETVGYEKTVKYARSLIRRDLSKQYEETLLGYKKQSIENY